MKRTRIQIDASREYFACKYCTFQALDIDILDNHISVSHSRKLGFSRAPFTKVIRRQTNNENVLKDDQKFSIVEGNNALRPASFSIDIESENVGVENNNEATEFSTVGGLTLCPYAECAFVCAYNGELEAHLRTEHTLGNDNIEQKVTYRCTECSYETQRKGDMSKHLLSHCTGVQMYGCPECPYKTKRKNDMPKHMLCHKNPEDVCYFQCEQCEYATKRKSDLNKHMITHNDLGAYICTECSYATKRQNDLNKHTLVHSDKEISGIFKCLKCDYGTDRVNKFAKHILSGCIFVDCCVTIRNVQFIQDIINQEEDVDEVDLMMEDVTKVLEGERSSKIFVLSEFYEQRDGRQINEVR